MLRKLLKNKKAQNTAEYAILISLVVAGIIAMQTYAQRALQARVRDAGVYLQEQTDGIGDGVRQYEPYYLDTAYNVISEDTTGESLLSNELTKYTDSVRTRQADGRKRTVFNADALGDVLSTGGF
jgi:Flp pilus assembly pilin Flp